LDIEREIVKALEELEHINAINRLSKYDPYPYQSNFHNAIGFDTEIPAKQRFLMAANGVGKTICGGMEAAMHLTGIYPDWFKGTRFHYPVEMVVGAKTNDAAVKVVQKILFGDAMDKQSLGTGCIPKKYLNTNFKMKPGIPGAIGEAMVKHITGRWSKVAVMSYDQKPKAFMGIRFDVGWLDEEPPSDIWSQFIRGTLSRINAILYITATPEEGMTPTVIQFSNDLKKGQALIQATWADAPHLSDEEKEQRLAAFPEHERDMRSKGIPMFGQGLIFPFPDEQLLVDPIQIPDYWPQIVGIDFGGGRSKGGHPFAAANLAWDRDSDTVYLTSEYRVKAQIPTQHADTIKKWGSWKPVAWPHDGLNTEKGTGDQLRESYSNAGLNMLREKATNPPDYAQGQEEGQGGISREKSLLDLYDRMENGKFKVFRTCPIFAEEKRMYHRDEHGKVVDLMDDVISATRYAHMMLRHSSTKTLKLKKPQMAVGIRNW
jgi:phage terminase large subunit-like protein